MNKRVKWVDVAKCIGIFLIYLGHNPTINPILYSFITKFHVPLFFFLSGYTENYDKETNYKKYVIKNIKKIMVPWAAFCIISLIFFIVENKPSFDLIRICISEMVLGGCIRNTFIAVSMWFLTCLFVMKLIFKPLRKINNNNIIILISLAVFIIATHFNFFEPKIPYNIDGALYYLIYYAIGYCTYSKITNFFEMKSSKAKYAFFISGFLSIIFGVIALTNPKLFVLNLYGNSINYAIGFIRTLVLIYMVLFVSRVLENISVLNSAGKMSLYFCGNEYITKRIAIISITALFGTFKIKGTINLLIFNAFVFGLSYIISMTEKKGIKYFSEKLKKKGISNYVKEKER